MKCHSIDLTNSRKTHAYSNIVLATELYRQNGVVSKRQLDSVDQEEQKVSIPLLPFSCCFYLLNWVKKA